MKYTGKRFLICQPVIVGINGSTVATLELADFLQKQGAKVAIYTCAQNQPAQKLFEDRKLKVLTPEKAKNLKLADFDYIWVHSQILPESIVQDLGQKHAKYPEFIFLHMSSMDWIPDEYRWIYNLEDSIASKSLYISDGTWAVNQPSAPKGAKPDFYRNPAPVEFCQIKQDKERELQKVLIVSNHPPKEVLEARDKLLKAGLQVDLYGQVYAGKYDLVTPEVLIKYDTVITIGKTVQYCLCAGVPVYVYDHFGGPGYLNAENYAGAKKYNFCGRRFNSKTSKEIADEVISNFTAAKTYALDNLTNFREEYAIDKVLNGILNSSKPRKIKPFEEKYLASVLLAQKFAINRFEMVKWDRESYRLLVKRDQDIARLNGEVEHLHKLLAESYAAQEQLLQSTTYKIGKIAMTPLNRIRSYGKKHRN